MTNPTPGMGYGRASLMTCISNMVHYAYTKQMETWLYCCLVPNTFYITCIRIDLFEHYVNVMVFDWYY